MVHLTFVIQSCNKTINTYIVLHANDTPIIIPWTGRPEHLKVGGLLFIVTACNLGALHSEDPNIEARLLSSPNSRDALKESLARTTA